MTKIKVEGDVEFLKRLGQEDIFSRKTIHLLVTEKDLPLFLTKFTHKTKNLQPEPINNTYIYI